MNEGLDLPAVLADIAEVAGLGAALSVANAKGGTEAYFPKPDNLVAGHWLVDLVGMDSARAIAARIGGGHCEVPLGPLGGNRGRAWRAIKKAIDEGKSAAEIARLTGLHQRTIRRHRNGHAGRAGGDGLQSDMFAIDCAKRGTMRG